MIKLEIDEKKYELPENFDELKLIEYCKVFHNLPKIEDEDEEVIQRNVLTNESIILSRLLGEDDDFAMNLPFATVRKLSNKLSYIYKIDDIIKEVKTSISLDGEKHMIPPFEEMQLRQFIDADQIIQDTENYRQYVELLATLLLTKDEKGKWKPYQGTTDEKIEKVGQIKCSEALPFIYRFFKLSNSSKEIIKEYSKEAIIQQVRHMQGL